jgi:hypothetical protein
MAHFMYRASGVAVYGRIIRPIDRHLEPQGVCVLPATGGFVSSRAGAFSLSDPASGEFLLSYDSAETTIRGYESAPGVHTTELVSTVRNINVGNVLKAEEVKASLTLNYTLKTDQVTIGTEGSRFVKLTIGGVPFEVAMDHDLGHKAADYEAFKKNHPALSEKRGKIHYALGQHPLLKFDASGYGYHHQPNFGRVYFGEWTAAPYTQTLTMLRLRLGSPQGGDLGFGGGDPNGTPPIGGNDN